MAQVFEFLRDDKPLPAAASAASLSPFDLESFLLNEAQVSEANLSLYATLLRDNAMADEEMLRGASKEDLFDCGIKPVGDRKRIMQAIAKRAGSDP